MFSSSFITFVTLSLLLRSTQATIATTGDLTIQNADVSPDGYERSAVTAGGSVVGELITGNVGDNFQINVINSLSDDTMLTETSIHWHGFFQASTAWADGAAFVTQCPIISGDSFLYDFNVPDQAGTFWYHSHLSTQYCDGLRGPFVVYDPSDPHASLYDVDDETTVWTLNDWYHDVAPNLVIPTPDANLFNGLGRSSSGDATDLGVATVTSGQRYRIRLINMACDPNYTFSIDNHTMSIIAVDGVNHEALEVDSIQIFAGQRYDFVLTADQDVGNYWIRFNPSVGDQDFDGGINSGILRYDGADEVEPTTEFVDATNALSEANLVPLVSTTLPGTAVAGGVDVAINLDMAFSGAGFTINDATWTSPSVPVLLQILSGTETADSLLPSDSLYSIAAGATVEISMPGGVAGGSHPFHLHGHTFYVVRSAGSETYNYDNPPVRDVVAIGADGDNVTIRFIADNAGPWFLHCHIDWHLELGLAIAFSEATDEWNSTITPSTAWDDLCPTYDATLNRRTLL